MSRDFNLNIPFTFQFAVATAGTPEKLSVKKTGTTIAFVDGDPDADTITDSDSGFLSAGFQAGDNITVSNSSSNDGTYVIASVTAGTITLLGRNELTTEGAAATVTITAPKSVPDGISVAVKAKYANTGVIHLADSSAKALSTSGGSFSLRNNETISLQVENISNVWIDATVTGEGVEVMFEKNVQA